MPGKPFSAAIPKASSPTKMQAAYEEPGGSEMAGMQSSRALLFAELTQLNLFARELGTHLDTREIELCRALAHEIMFSIGKAIRLASSIAAVEAEQQPSNGGNQRAENLGRASDPKQRMPKRRKTLPMWTTLVRVRDGVAGGTPDDGYSWRKYGQKDILGAKYPRAYFRCTHRNGRGCPAIKQVQRSAGDSAVLEITYRGTHTCSQQPRQTTCPKNELQQSFPDRPNACEHPNFQSSLRAETESWGSEHQDPRSSFTFPSSLTKGIKAEQDVLCFSPEFVSPWTSDPELAEMISAMASESDSCDVDSGLVLGVAGMDPDEPFDTSIFFA